MRILKTFGLGTSFLFAALFAYVVIAVMRGGVQVETGPAHATGVSAIIAGLLEAAISTILNVRFWLLVLVAYGAAFWIVRRHAR
jgi:hypothetical protein